MSNLIDLTKASREHAELAKTKPVTLHPNTVGAINSEMARYEAREVRLLAEVAELHKVIGQLREHCQEAQKHCMMKGSLQWLELKWAMELADSRTAPEADDDG
jgi:hypothetical protein